MMVGEWELRVCRQEVCCPFHHKKFIFNLTQGDLQEVMDTPRCSKLETVWTWRKRKVLPDNKNKIAETFAVSEKVESWKLVRHRRRLYTSIDKEVKSLKSNLYW